MANPIPDKYCQRRLDREPRRRSKREPVAAAEIEARRAPRGALLAFRVGTMAVQAWRL